MTRTATALRYSPEELERQLNPRAFSPDHERAIAAGLAMSEAYRAERPNARYDVAYGKSAAETLDLFLPPSGAMRGTAGAPVEIYVHGGFWRSRDKRDFSYLARPIVDAGGISAVMNYGLCPAVTLDEIVRQVRACVVWIWRNAGDFGGDPNRIQVTGHSAGGHLTAMLAMTDWRDFGTDVPHDVVKSAVPTSGIYDVAPVMQTAVQAEVRLDPAMAERNSPLLHAPRQTFPMAVAVGALESDEFRRQSREYAAHMAAHGARVEFFEMPDQDHFTILTESLQPGNRLAAARLSLMGLSG